MSGVPNSAPPAKHEELYWNYEKENVCVGEVEEKEGWEGRREKKKEESQENGEPN